MHRDESQPLLFSLHVEKDPIFKKYWVADHYLYREEIEREVKSIEKEGYIVAKIYANCIYYHLTSKAIDYFPEKSKQEEQQKKINRKATHRYWLDKLIPFLALLVSVIAMLNSVFDWWQV